MSDLFESIRRGLEEAVAHSQGEKTGVRLFTPEEVNVKKVREKTGLTQEQFAATFGISLGTLRHWERGDRKPHGPALVLLNAVAKEPGTLLADIDWRPESKRVTTVPNACCLLKAVFGIKNRAIRRFLRLIFAILLFFGGLTWSDPRCQS